LIANVIHIINGYVTWKEDEEEQVTLTQEGLVLLLELILQQ